ncbi:MAG: TonB-dependent receptor [Gammaproteobacteria bacterium]|nr:TonB-dependent receptor [Gammaproteobacteria bacterium]
MATAAGGMVRGMGISPGVGWRCVPSLLLMVCLLWMSPVAASSLVGRSVQDVLREFSGSGLNIIFSSDVVPPDLTVQTEVASPGGVAAVREILMAHGLVLIGVGEGVWAVARAPAGHAVVPPTAAPAVVETPTLVEIVVTTSRYALAGSETDSRTFLSQHDVRALPRFADEPLRAVQHLPGSASSGFSALTHLRGGAYDEVLMVLDGLPLNEPFHLKHLLAPVSVLDAEAIGSIDVSSGGFTAQYGDRMSGVIDITPLETPAERSTVLGLSLFHLNGLSAGRFADSRGQWLLSARRSNLDVLAELVHSKVGSAGYSDLLGRIAWGPDEDTLFFAGTLIADDDFDGNTADGSERLSATYRNRYLWGGWRQYWGSGLSSRAILALTDIDNKRSGRMDKPGRQSGWLDDDRNLDVIIARLDVEHHGQRLYTRFGGEARESHGRYRYRSNLVREPDWPFPGDPGVSMTRDLAPEPESHQFAAYVSSRVWLGAGLSAELGLRWDKQVYDDDSGPREVSPRINLMYELSPATRLRAAWGRFWQSQAVNELQVEDGIDTFYDAQRADHFIVSLEQALGERFGLRVEAYVKDYDRVQPYFENLYDPVQLLPELEPNRVRVAPASSRARGVELLLRQRDAGPWSWWLSYAWSRVTDDIGGRAVPRSWDQRHGIGAGLRYAGQHWEFTLTDVFHTGWPTTRPDLGLDTTSGLVAIDSGERNASRYRNFNSLDFRALRRYRLQAGTLEAFFELGNMLGQRNQCCTRYEVRVDGAAAVLDRDVEHWLRLIPNLGVSWRF